MPEQAESLPPEPTLPTPGPTVAAPGTLRGGTAAGQLAPFAPHPRPSRLVALLAGLGLFVTFGPSLGGEIGRLASVGALAYPLIVLTALLQLSRFRPGLAPIAWAIFWLAMLSLAGISVGLVMLALMAGPAAAPDAEAARELLSALGLTLSSLVFAVVLITTGAWWWIGRRLGGKLDRASRAQAQAVAGMLGGTALCLMPLVVLGGEPPFLKAIAGDPGRFSEIGLDRSSVGQVFDVYYELIWIIPLALVAAGVPLYRRLRDGLQRLGLGPLGRRDLLAVIPLVAGLLLLANLLDGGIGSLWAGTGWPRTDSEALDKLFGVATKTAAGALAASISAGVGEELMIRGVLQPRFGWLLPNLAFTGLHAFQYGLDGLLVVFVLGASLAAIRARWNTTMSMLVHGLYDLALLLATVFGVSIG